MSRPLSRHRPPAPTRQVAPAGYASAPQRTVGTFVKGVGSLLLLIGFIAGVPYVLIRMGAYPTSIPDPASLWRSLTGPDLSGRGVFTVIAGLVWIGWVWFTLSVLRETAAAIFSRGHRPRRHSRPGTRRPVRQRTWSVQPAAVLVAAVVAMFITTPLLAATRQPGPRRQPRAAAPPRGPAPSPPPRNTPPPARPPQPPRVRPRTAADLSVSSATHSAAQPTASSGSSVHKASATLSASTKRPPSTTSKSSTVTYTVRRYDTLWSIAERQLGDPTRFHEIVTLNPHLKKDMTIHAGDVLTLPAAADHTESAGVGGSPTHSSLATGEATGPMVHDTVELGDTLSEISADHGVKDWHTVWEANKGKAQPGGKHFTNPDHIEVGWDIAIPTSRHRRPGPPSPPGCCGIRRRGPARSSGGVTRPGPRWALGPVRGRGTGPLERGATRPPHRQPPHPRPGRPRDAQPPPRPPGE